MPGRTRDHLTLVVLALVVVASGLDIATDLGHGAPVAHLLQEGTVMAGAFALVLWIVLDLRRQARRAEWLEAELAAAREQAARRTPELERARERLGRAIADQFETWGLSESEQAVGWLLLKGPWVARTARPRSAALCVRAARREERV